MPSLVQIFSGFKISGGTVALNLTAAQSQDIYDPAKNTPHLWDADFFWADERLAGCEPNFTLAFVSGLVFCVSES